MKVTCLDPNSQAAINITSLSRRYGIEFADYSPALPARSMIVLGNGTPDDIACAIVCHHTDGPDCILMVKPKVQRGLDSLESLKLLSASVSHSVSKYGLIMDQERLEPDDLFHRAVEKLNQFGIRVDSSSRIEYRAFRFGCSLATRVFDVLVVLNGHPEVESENHCVEDHLLWANGMRSPIVDSKSFWNSLREDHRRGVIRKLVDESDLARSSFPQQFAVLGLLHD